MAEAGDLKSPKCQFESDRGHMYILLASLLLIVGVILFIIATIKGKRTLLVLGILLFGLSFVPIIVGENTRYEEKVERCNDLGGQYVDVYRGSDFCIRDGLIVKVFND